MSNVLAYMGHWLAEHIQFFSAELNELSKGWFVRSNRIDFSVLLRIYPFNNKCCHILSVHRLQIIVSGLGHRKEWKFPDKIGNIVDDDTFLRSVSKNGAGLDNIPPDT